MKLDGNIHYTMLELMPGVPLYVYSLRGSEYSILIDTGIAQMKKQIEELCAETGNINTVLITHAHADHIGCNKAVKQLTTARFYAAGALTWIEDLETHYKEFCIPNPDIPDSAEQRAEILGLMDGAIHVDAVICEGVRFRPGNDIDLEVISFPGHKLEEVAFLNHLTGDLLMGDVLPALAAPFFHGFQGAQQFVNSLLKLRNMIAAGTVNRILCSHHAPLGRQKSIELIDTALRFLSDVKQNVLLEANDVSFTELWKNVSAKMNKVTEFRGYAMLKVQVEELVADGALTIENGKIKKK